MLIQINIGVLSLNSIIEGFPLRETRKFFKGYEIFSLFERWF